MRRYYLPALHRDRVSSLESVGRDARDEACPIPRQERSSRVLPKGTTVRGGADADRDSDERKSLGLALRLTSAPPAIWTIPTVSAAQGAYGQGTPITAVLRRFAAALPTSRGHLGLRLTRAPGTRASVRGAGRTVVERRRALARRRHECGSLGRLRADNR